MFIFDDSIYPIINTPPDPTLLSINPSPPPTAFIQPSILITPTETLNPQTTRSHEFLRYPPKDVVQGLPGARTACDVSELSGLPLFSLDDLSWFNTLSSSKASSASASAPSVLATLHKGDVSGFDQFSLFDEVCASALNTPLTPYPDTPDQTPNQTPLFDCVASEDLDMISLEQLWTAANSNVGAISTAASGSDLNLSLDLTLPHSAALTALSGHDGSNAQDPSQVDARLQAETALLDFVLFDDIAPPSPISTISTPMTTSLSSPSHVDLKFKQEIETDELALQLVAAAAASMHTRPSAASMLMSPVFSDSSDVLGSLFSDVDLSPLMESASPASTVTSSPQMSLDWTMTQLPQNFSFDVFNNNLININDAAGNTGAFAMPSSPMLPVAVTSPQLDLGFLFTLYSQQQLQQLQQFQQQQLSLQMTKTTTTTNQLKRKSDEIEQDGVDLESPQRQFACSQCGRAFSRLFNLNTHERTHDRSKARLFACPEQGCTKSFTRKNDLQRHQISIHGVTNIFSCQKCCKAFSKRDELRRHMELKSCEDDHDDQTHSHDHPQA